MRPGTENTLLVVALGEAASIAHRERESFVKKMNLLREQLLRGLTETCGANTFVVTVPRDHGTNVLCNTLHLCFRRGLKSANLIRELGDRVLASGQSACKTGNSLSHVLKAMNIETSLIRGALRLSLGRTTTEKEIEQAIEIIGNVARSIVDDEKISAAKTKELSTTPVYMCDTHKTNLDDSKVLSVFKIEEERHKIKSSDTTRFIMILDKTIFHPQGGGQPSDVGEIRFSSNKFVVSKVVSSPIPSERSRGVIWHIGNFTTTATTEFISCDSKLQDTSIPANVFKELPSQHVDRASRMLYAKLHSAGHLIDVAMQQCGVGLKAGKGFHFPKGSYVEYVGKLGDDLKDTLKDRLQKALNGLIKMDIPTTIHHVPPSKVSALCFDGHCGDMSHLPQDKNVRVVCVGGEKGCPCGGTHVKSTKEIEKIIVKKVKNKKGNLRISYSLS